jgi:hypothetical protein
MMILPAAEMCQEIRIRPAWSSGSEIIGLGRGAALVPVLKVDKPDVLACQEAFKIDPLQAVRENEKIDACHHDGRTEIRLPKLSIYEVFVINLGPDK